MSGETEAEGKKAWRGNTFGNAFMLRSLISVLRHSDVRIWYVVVGIFVVPFCMLCFPSGKVVFHYFPFSIFVYDEIYNILRLVGNI